eukprot:447347-Rhodomonas_salina.1
MKKERAPARVLRMSIEHKGGPSLLSSEHACVTCVTCVTCTVTRARTRRAQNPTLSNPSSAARARARGAEQNMLHTDPWTEDV